MKTPEEIIDDAVNEMHALAQSTGEPAIKALDAAGYEIREKIPDTHAIVPKEMTHEQISAAFGARAGPPDETPILLDCLDFGGENAALRLVRAAYRAAIDAGSRS